MAYYKKYRAFYILYKFFSLRYVRLVYFCILKVPIDA